METLKKQEQASDSCANTLFSSRYELVRPLKDGGTSKIYLVKDRLCLSKLAAIKCICRDALQIQGRHRLAVTEFSMGRALSHPNIINIYNVHRTAKSEYLVMEFLEGTSLKDFLSRATLNSDQVVELIAPIVDALAYLHQNGVVHCDVKPSNIIVGTNRLVKLIDLATCRQDSNNANPPITVSENSFFGFSKYYSSPQVVKDMPATLSDDVYSLAIVVYEMLAGSIPSEAFDNEVLNISMLTKPQAINAWQWRVLKKAMHPNNNKRYASVQSFFGAFCRARQSTYVMAGIAVFCLCALLLTGYFSNQWEHYRANHLQHQVAHQQLDTIKTLSDTIRQALPEQRHLMLGLTDDLDEFTQRLVLAEVYNDVANPLIDRAYEAMHNHHKSNELLGLLEQLNGLSTYYKNSKEISRLTDEIASERNLRLQSALFVATELVNPEVYNELSADRVRDHAQKYKYEWFDIVQEIDLNTYFAQVDIAVASKNWPVAIRLHRFAHALSDILPQAMQVWLKYSAVAEHVKLFSTYLSSDQRGVNYFPERSAEFFIADRFNELNESLDNVWFNKDFKRYSTELLSIKSEYNIPESYDKYQQMHSLLLEKIDKKIRYHRRSGQRQSMQFLIDLKNTLS